MRVPRLQPRPTDFPPFDSFQSHAECCVRTPQGPGAAGSTLVKTPEYGISFDTMFENHSCRMQCDGTVQKIILNSLELIAELFLQPTSRHTPGVFIAGLETCPSEECRMIVPPRTRTSKSGNRCPGGVVRASRDCALHLVCRHRLCDTSSQLLFIVKIEILKASRLVRSIDCGGYNQFGYGARQDCSPRLVYRHRLCDASSQLLFKVKIEMLDAPRLVRRINRGG